MYQAAPVIDLYRDSRTLGPSTFQDTSIQYANNMNKACRLALAA